MSAFYHCRMEWFSRPQPRAHGKNVGQVSALTPIGLLECLSRSYYLSLTNLTYRDAMAVEFLIP
jgi:hypothetical protein